MMISSARTSTTEDDIRRVFGKLNLGELEKIDIVPAHSRGIECLKIFIHYAQMTSDSLRERLDINDERQKAGDMVEPIKIIYGRSREGRDQYWQIYKCKTPAERLAVQTAKTEEFTVRIEM